MTVHFIVNASVYTKGEHAKPCKKMVKVAALQTVLGQVQAMVSRTFTSTKPSSSLLAPCAYSMPRLRCTLLCAFEALSVTVWSAADKIALNAMATNTDRNISLLLTGNGSNYL